MLDRFHKISEIIAAFAIIGSLVFVGVQMQLNTKAIRISAGQGMITTWAETNRDISSDPQMSQYVWDIITQDGALPEGADSLRIRLWIQNAIRQAEFNYFNWRDGNLDKRYSDQSMAVLARFLRSSSGNILWKEIRVTHDPMFQQAMNDAISVASTY